MYKSLTSLVKFISKYFIVFNAIVNEIIFFSFEFFLVYRNDTVFVSDLGVFFSFFGVEYVLYFDMSGLHWGQFSSVQFSLSVVSDSLRPHESQHARPPCPSQTPGVHSDSRPSSQ